MVFYPRRPRSRRTNRPGVGTRRESKRMRILLPRICAGRVGASLRLYIALALCAVLLTFALTHSSAQRRVSIRLPAGEATQPASPNSVSLLSIQPGLSSVLVTVNSVTYVDPTHVTLELNTVAATLGAKNITITEPDRQSATTNK